MYIVVYIPHIGCRVLFLVLLVGIDQGVPVEL